MNLIDIFTTLKVEKIELYGFYSTSINFVDLYYKPVHNINKAEFVVFNFNERDPLWLNVWDEVKLDTERNIVIVCNNTLDLTLWQQVKLSGLKESDL